MVEKESHMTARLLAWVAKEMCVLHQDRKMEKLVCEGGWRRLPKGYTGQQCYCSTYCRQNGFLPLLGKYPFPYLMGHRVQGDGQLSRRLIRGGIAHPHHPHDPCRIRSFSCAATHPVIWPYTYSSKRSTQLRCVPQERVPGFQRSYKSKCHRKSDLIFLVNKCSHIFLTCRSTGYSRIGRGPLHKYFLGRLSQLLRFHLERHFLEVEH